MAGADFRLTYAYDLGEIFQFVVRSEGLIATCVFFSFYSVRAAVSAQTIGNRGLVVCAVSAGCVEIRGRAA
jgi:hypothetical protein